MTLLKMLSFEFNKFIFYNHSPIDTFDIIPIVSKCLGHNRSTVDFILNQFNSVSNMTVVTSVNYIQPMDSMQNISYTLNNCPYQYDYNATVKEYLFQLAIAIYPWNHNTVKNLAYIYEWEGFTDLSESLLLQSYRVIPNKGTLIHYVFTTSSTLYSYEDMYVQLFYLLEKYYKVLCMIQYITNIHYNINSAVISTTNTATTTNPTNVMFMMDSNDINAQYMINMTEVNYPYIDITELQLNFEYLGLHPGALSKLYIQLVHQLFQYPQQAQVDVPSEIQMLQEVVTNSNIIRIGIMSEFVKNSSPGLCIMKVFEMIIKLQEIYNPTIKIEFIYFIRPNDNTYSTEILSKIATEVYLIKENFAYETADIILQSRVEVLLYLALPTEKLTLLLSMLRLAPIQIQYGLGHPLSSGSFAIDYSIITSHMIPNYHSLTTIQQPQPQKRQQQQQDNNDSRVILSDIYSSSSSSSSSSLDELNESTATKKRSIYSTLSSTLLSKYMLLKNLLSTSPYNITMKDIATACSILDHHSTIPHEKTSVFPWLQVQSVLKLLHDNCPRIGPISQSYEEQLILFDSLGYYLEDPLTLYESTEHIDPYQYAVHSSCEEIDSILHTLRPYFLYPLTFNATHLGCETHDRMIHIYMNMQPFKKLHPLFDEVLKGILHRDPYARILVSSTAEVLVKRWKQSLNMTTDMIRNRFIFVKRMPHELYLRLLGLSSIFLNTFPFGAGVTSSEALAMCVPIIVYPEKTSILQFALAQLRILNNEEKDIERLFVVHSISSYIHTAGSYVMNRTLNQELRQLLCSRKSQLFSNDRILETAKEWYDFLIRIVKQRRNDYQ